MAEFVVLVDRADERKLKEVLAKDPYARDSFVLAGYTLREAKALGQTGDHHVLYYKCEDGELAKALENRLKEVPSAKPAPDAVKNEIIAKLNADEENAAEGFGSIFG